MPVEFVPWPEGISVEIGFVIAAVIGWIILAYVFTIIALAIMFALSLILWALVIYRFYQKEYKEAWQMLGIWAVCAFFGLIFYGAILSPKLQERKQIRAFINTVHQELQTNPIEISGVEFRSQRYFPIDFLSGHRKIVRLSVPLVISHNDYLLMKATITNRGKLSYYIGAYGRPGNIMLTPFPGYGAESQMMVLGPGETRKILVHLRVGDKQNMIEFQCFAGYPHGISREDETKICRTFYSIPVSWRATPQEIERAKQAKKEVEEQRKRKEEKKRQQREEDKKFEKEWNSAPLAR